MVDESLVGRVVVKSRGRDAGLKGVVVSVYGDGYVLVTGPKPLTGLRRSGKTPETAGFPRMVLGSRRDRPAPHS